MCKDQLAINGGEKAAADLPNRFHFGKEEKAAADALFDRCIETGNAIGYNGPQEEAFGKEFAEYLGGGYADGDSYGSPRNTSYSQESMGYGSPRNSSYSQQEGASAPRGSAPRDNGGYGRPDSGYDSYSRSVNPPQEEMPPMPPQEGAEGTGMVDDIPF